jgi:hypothetical protein
MKKSVFILLIVLLVLAISNLILFAEEAKYNFRKTNWGMSKEEVKDSEWWTNPITNKSYKHEPKYDLGNEISYYANIAEIEGNLTYEFVENKLIGARYNFTEEFEDREQYIINFYKIKEYLTKKYGKPEIGPQEKSSVKEILEEIKLFERILGINGIHYPCAAYWTLSKTEIRFVLIYEKGNFHLVLGYYSLELMDWAEQIKEKEILKDL